MKRFNAKRDGASFPKVKDRKFRRWVATLPCVLRGHWTTRRLSDHDLDAEDAPSFILQAIGGFWHQCWGDMTPMHVGAHQARGAADVGHCVPACQAAHGEYDDHRSRWYRVTHLTEKRLQKLAADLAVRYSEGG